MHHTTQSTYPDWILPGWVSAVSEIHELYAFCQVAPLCHPSPADKSGWAWQMVTSNLRLAPFQPARPAGNQDLTWHRILSHTDLSSAGRSDRQFVWHEFFEKKKKKISHKLVSFLMLSPANIQDWLDKSTDVKYKIWFKTKTYFSKQQERLTVCRNKLQYLQFGIYPWPLATAADVGIWKTMCKRKFIHEK